MNPNGTKPGPAATYEDKRDIVLHGALRTLEGMMQQTKVAMDQGDESPVELDPPSFFALLQTIAAGLNIAKDVLYRSEELERLVLTEEQRASLRANTEAKLGVSSIVIAKEVPR